MTGCRRSWLLVQDENSVQQAGNRQVERRDPTTMMPRERGVLLPSALIFISSVYVTLWCTITSKHTSTRHSITLLKVHVNAGSVSQPRMHAHMHGMSVTAPRGLLP